jgi:2-polyprenyl-6-methoxyphenol hydroxylase-like FAD-dependent oxidoreductase
VTSPRHILVIGGGPAGSLAATLLARANVRVTLVEQARFPRDKVCGECLSALGIAVLTRHGLIHRLRVRGAIPLTRALFHTTTGESCELPLPQPMLGLSRRSLDALLLDAADDAGAMIRQPARCEHLQSTPTGVTATIRSIANNREETIIADLAIVADGKSILPTGRPVPTGDFGLKAHFANVHAPPNAIELFGVNGHYGGLSAIEDGRWNTSFSVPADRLRAAGGNLDELVAEITAESPAFAQRTTRAQRASEWHTSPLPRFGVVRDWPMNIIPVGNAAAAIEPIGGEGIGLALRSAELAIDSLLRDPFDVNDLKTRYRELWTARRLACRTAAKIMSSPTWSAGVLPFVTPDNPLVDSLLNWIGKTSANA